MWVAAASCGLRQDRVSASHIHFSVAFSCFPKSTTQEIISYIVVDPLYPWGKVSSVCYYFETEHPCVFFF